MGATDVYGKRTYGAWVRQRVGIVKLEQRTDKTSVRTDSSASRGSAKEVLADARILFPKNVILKEGDRIRVVGMLLTVQSVWPRHRITGELDHWQVDCEVWAG
jgi:hypothetical protein